MATRIYLQNANADITPSAWHSSWGTPVSGNVTKKGSTTKGATAFASLTATSGGVAATLPFMRFVYGPIGAHDFTSQTLKGQIRGQEANAAAQCCLAHAIRILKPDGTERAVLRAPAYATTMDTNPPEFRTALTNNKFREGDTDTTINLASVSSQNGDYIVIEIGMRKTASSTARNITLRYGDNDASNDLPEDDTSTSDYCPWVEFSTTITAYTAPVTATLSVTLDALTLSGAATVSGPVATLTATLDALTSSSGATVSVGASLSSTLDAATLTSDVDAIAGASLSVTLDAATLSSTGEVTTPGPQGTLEVTLGSLEVGTYQLWAESYWTSSFGGVLNRINDGETGPYGVFDTTNVAVGSSVKLDVGSGNDKAFTKFIIWNDPYQTLGEGEYWDIQYSDNDSSWTTVVSQFDVTATRSVSVTWASSGAHRYWRLYKSQAWSSGTVGGWKTEFQYYDTPSTISVAVAATASPTLDALTLSSDVDTSVSASLSSTLNAATLSSDVDVIATASLSATLDTLTLSSDVDAIATGSLSTTLDALTLSSDVDNKVSCSLTSTLDELSLSASASTGALSSITATLNVTLDSLTVSSDVDAIAGCTLSQTLDELSIVSSASVSVAATLSATLDSLTLSSTGKIHVAGALSTTLDSLTLTSSSSSALTANLAVTLDSATLSSTGETGRVASLSVTLDALTISSTGSILPIRTATLSAQLSDLTYTIDGIIVPGIYPTFKRQPPDVPGLVVWFS